MTKAAELRELTDERSSTASSEAKQELCKLRFDHATGQLDSTTRDHERTGARSRASTR